MSDRAARELLDLCGGKRQSLISIVCCQQNPLLEMASERSRLAAAADTESRKMKMFVFRGGGGGGDRSVVHYTRERWKQADQTEGTTTTQRPRQTTHSTPPPHTDTLAVLMLLVATAHLCTTSVLHANHGTFLNGFAV